jgi:LuxR family transcriptional regulator, maltose regulon positive regulatory protein
MRGAPKPEHIAHAGADPAPGLHLRACWRMGDAAALSAALNVSRDALGPAAADRWHALLGLLQERADVLAYLDRAWQADTAAHKPAAARRDAQIALVACLLDYGAMDQVAPWLARWTSAEASADGSAAAPADADDGPGEFWAHAACVAAGVLSGSAGRAQQDAAERLWSELRALDPNFSANERLIAGQLLVNHRFAEQAYAQFGLLASVLEEPAPFAAASALMRVRWLYTVGYALYQIGELARAQRSWQRALDLCRAEALDGSALMVSLALVRLLLDNGQLAQAQQVLEGIDPDWGAGRAAQLIALQQMRARAQLLAGQPARALALLNEALDLARAAALPDAELAACRTDLAQILHALARDDEAIALLDNCRARHAGRDAQVFGVLHDLLRAWALREQDPAAARALLAGAFSAAQQLRYTMFVRLLPQRAGALCALALRWQIEAAFVQEVIRARRLPAPEDAGAHWPWVLWVRLLGGFEMRLAGRELPSEGKAQARPLELLRMMAVERRLSVSLVAAMDALWPDASGDTARKSLDMTVARLRKLLGSADLVQIGDGRVGLNRAQVQSDVALRRQLIDALETLSLKPDGGRSDAQTAGRRAQHAQDLIEQIGALGSDELLPDLPDSPWLTASRARCHQDAVRAAQAAAQLMDERGANALEISLLETAIRYEPLAQSLVHRLMRSHVLRGARGDALRVLQAFERALAALDQPPSSATRELARQLGLVAAPR